MTRAGRQHGQRESVRAKGGKLLREDHKGLTCQRSPFRARVTERLLIRSMGTDLPLARLDWRFHGKCGYDGETKKTTSRRARHEIMRERAKAVGSEEKGHERDASEGEMMVYNLHILKGPLV